ncbi:MAG: hypothetical protein ACREFO_10775 [Acetobacteraceae bacterium]
MQAPAKARNFLLDPAEPAVSAPCNRIADEAPSLPPLLCKSPAFGDIAAAMAGIDVNLRSLFATPVAAVLLPGVASSNAALRHSIPARRGAMPSAQVPQENRLPGCQRCSGQWMDRKIWSGCAGIA